MIANTSELYEFILVGAALHEVLAVTDTKKATLTNPLS
jgi:hypothetical protein